MQNSTPELQPVLKERVAETGDVEVKLAALAEQVKASNSKELGKVDVPSGSLTAMTQDYLRTSVKGDAKARWAALEALGLQTLEKGLPKVQKA